MGWIVDSPPRLKIDPTELSYSCSHRPMIAHKWAVSLGIAGILARRGTDLRLRSVVSDRGRPLVTPVNGTTITAANRDSFCRSSALRCAVTTSSVVIGVVSMGLTTPSAPFDVAAVFPELA